MTGAEIVVQALIDQGVDTIFGYPGGAVLPIYDALFAEGRIKHILVRHEQAAVHAAEGYARSSGKVGVVLVTSGPGATNAVTGITDAMMDSIPLVVITGQVPTHLIGTDAFQECDTVGITRHCSKHNYLIKETARLASALHEAFYIARSGRPGPVVIDIPKDVQIMRGPYAAPTAAGHKTYKPQTKGDQTAIETAVEMLAAAERPILYTGGGVINSGPHATTLLRALAALTGAPVTSTLMGLGTMEHRHKQFLGMLGMHGSYEANMAMNRCDLMLCIGARFDDRVTGRLDAFSPHSKKIHIDIDRSSINKTVKKSWKTCWRCGKPAATPHRTSNPGGRTLPAGVRAIASGSSSKALPCCRKRPSSGCGKKPAIRRRSSPPKSASIRCGPPSTSASTPPTNGSPRVGWARWAMACPPRSAPSSPTRARSSSTLPAKPASR
ncbi:hypothetical protein GCM10007973_13170 [Polymorphobacter multimanifer]|nr:hypothetical protein GCM10007973_13170 [Polymorphobacter multimanifer]